jgi:hypothetical protein
MNFSELKKIDPALANAIQELIGNESPDFYRGFQRALQIFGSDQKTGINRLEQYSAFCDSKLKPQTESPSLSVEDVQIEPPRMIYRRRVKRNVEPES